MRAFAAAWPDLAIVQGTLAQLPWYHNITLLEAVDDSDTRFWYAFKIIENGWSQPTLRLQIKNLAHKRHGKAITNFKAVLPSAESDMASQMFKDPYLFDFLGTADPRREREVEKALLDHIQRFLLELGAGFAFVGSQIRLDIADDEFQPDLLFYHLRLRCFVVVELKVVPFDPGFIGTLNMYLSAMDDLRHPDDKPSIGLLLCRSKNKLVVEYALRNITKPIGVAEWETTIFDSLPEHLIGSLPSVEEIEAELRWREDSVS
jgi:predicted nuclease of restriction endonuclease-like (RecB) superfamily